MRPDAIFEQARLIGKLIFKHGSMFQKTSQQINISRIFAVVATCFRVQLPPVMCLIIFKMPLTLQSMI